jgi:hypothetical protein
MDQRMWMGTVLEKHNIGRLIDTRQEGMRRKRKRSIVSSFSAIYLRELMVVPWRLRSRLKTFNCGMFICLNIGVDPPDVVKTNPCAKLECWLDPTALPSSKAIDAIGRSRSI